MESKLRRLSEQGAAFCIGQRQQLLSTLACYSPASARKIGAETFFPVQVGLTNGPIRGRMGRPFAESRAALAKEHLGPETRKTAQWAASMSRRTGDDRQFGDSDPP